MRITINLNDEILAKVDAEAKRIGTSRGAMLTTWVGEKIHALEQSRLFLEKIQSEEMLTRLRGEVERLQKENAELQPTIFDVSNK